MQNQLAKVSRPKLLSLVTRAIAIVPVFCLALAALPASAQTLDRIRDAGRVRFGYLADARPLSFRNDAGAADGYGVALCQRIADALEVQLSRPTLLVEWVAITGEARLAEVQQGNIDLLCTPMSVTLARRADAAFSIPVFPSGNRAVMRADAVPALRSALGGTGIVRPVWRGSPAAKVVEDTSFAVVAGTTSASWLEERAVSLQVDARITQVPDYRTGLQRLMARDVDVFFGDRALALGAMDDAAREELVVLDRLFTHESLALPLASGDDDFRLVVDRALSGLYTSGDFAQLYRQWFGEFDTDTRTFFMWNTLAE
jgi:polar amino acid transport system substrate-binding protein